MSSRRIGYVNPQPKRIAGSDKRRGDSGESICATPFASIDSESLFFNPSYYRQTQKLMRDNERE